MSSPWTALGNDALDRLASIDSAADTNFAEACPERSRRDGLNMIAEYDTVGNVQTRYVHGPGMDQPLVRYDGAGTGNKQSLHADERGSIVALSYGAAYAPNINRYDEYGRTQSTNVGRFQYTGQMWLPEAGLYHYKARAYGPHLGRFLQTDPIGYQAGPNLYAYVGNDPVNWVDPLGQVGLPGALIGGTIGAFGGGGGAYIASHAYSSGRGSGASFGGFLTAVFTGGAVGAATGASGSYIILGGAAVIGLAGAGATSHFDAREEEKKKKSNNKKGP